MIHLPKGASTALGFHSLPQRTATPLFGLAPNHRPKRPLSRRSSTDFLEHSCTTAMSGLSANRLGAFRPRAIPQFQVTMRMCGVPESSGTSVDGRDDPFKLLWG